MNALLAEREAAPAETIIPRVVSLDDAVSKDVVQGMLRYGFRIGPWGFLFPEHCPGEIVYDPDICPIPHTRSWMPGVMILRGNLVPVFDLHDLLLDAPADPHKPMVLILDQGKQALGFMLKEPPQWLSELVEAPITAADLPDPVAAQISKVYRQQETSWLAFDKTEFFTFLAESAKSC
ncbi:MAG: chemotaxis protein CheW [Gammaproteobacteria bacterium]